MEYRYLGAGGLLVSSYCFGSLTLGPLAANLPVEQGGRLLLTAFERGVTFVDTAEQYQTYPYIRWALERFPQRERVVVATKTFADTAQQAAWALEDARIALGRNRLDIFLLHEVRDRSDWDERAAAWRLLCQARDNNIITAVGLSTHSAAVAAWAAEEPDIQILHLLVNEAGFGVREGGVSHMLAAAARARARGKGVYGMKALAGGALAAKAKTALQWAFNRPELDAVAVGCREECELLTNLAWLEGVEDPPRAGEIAHIPRRLVFDKEPRCHGCGKCVAKCPNNALSIVDGEAIWTQDKCLFCGYCVPECPWFCLSFC